LEFAYRTSHARNIRLRQPDASCSFFFWCHEKALRKAVPKFSLALALSQGNFVTA
jgi:hypothetical protein